MAQSQVVQSATPMTEKAVHETSDLGNRMKKVRERLGYTQSGMSAAVGSKLRSWQEYERGSRAPGSAVIAGLARLGVNTNWLLTGEGSVLVGESGEVHDLGKRTDAFQAAASLDEFYMVPQYDVEASAGGGSMVEREAEVGKLAFRRSWLREKGLVPKDLAVIRIRGDSMSPTIRGGSIVLVDTRERTPGEDGIYVLLHDHHLVAKRLQPDWRGGMSILSDNPAYERQYITADELKELTIVGRVVWAAGDIA